MQSLYNVRCKNRWDKTKLGKGAKQVSNRGQFLKKIKSNYFGFFGIGVCLVLMLIAFNLYTTVDPSFSILSNFGSDLGVGPNGSNIVFRLAMILTGLIFVPYILSLTNSLRDILKNSALVKLASVLLILQIAGVSLSGVFPFDVTQPLVFQIHVVAAFMLFGVGAFSHLLVGRIFQKKQEVPRIIPLFYLLSVVPMALFTTLFLIETYSISPYQTITFLSEWISFGMIILCVVVTSIYLIKHQ